MSPFIRSLLVPCLIVLLGTVSRGADPTPARTDAGGDPLPAGARARLGSVRLCHGGMVTCLIYSPDGKRLASAGDGPAIRLWDPDTGKELLHLAGHPDGVTGLAFTPDGRQLVSAGGDQMIRVWDTTTGQEIRQWSATDEVPLCLALSPDGKTLATPGPQNSICLWDLTTGKELRQLKGPQQPTMILAFAPDGRRLLSGTMQEGFFLWDLASGKRLRQYAPSGQGPWGQVAMMLFSPDGRTLAGGDMQGAIRFWEASSIEQVRQVQAHQAQVMGLAFSPDGKVIASSGMDGLHTWEVESGRSLQKLAADSPWATALVFSPDGKTLAAANHAGRIRLWDRATGKERLPAGPSEPFAAFVYNAADQTLVSVDAHALRHWDLKTGKAAKPIELGGGEQQAVVLAPDGKTLALVRAGQGIALLDTATGKERRKIDADKEGGVLQLAFSPDGKVLATVGQQVPQPLRLWDVATGKELRHLSRRPAYVSLLEFSPDGRLLAATDADGSVELWELASGKLRSRLRSGGTRLGGGPDEDMMMMMRQRAMIMRMQFRGGMVIGGMPAQFGGVGPGMPGSAHAQAFSPDGRLLALPREETIQLWDAARGQLVRSLGGHRKNVTAVAFSPDGRLLASGGEDQELRLWRVDTGVSLGRLEGHRGAIRQLHFTSDGRTLISAGEEGSALVWDVVEALAAARRHSVPEMSTETREALWTDLAAADAARAGRAMVRLEEVPDEAVRLFRERLRPVPVVEPRRLSQLIASLDSKRFAVREKATQELEQLGDLAGPALRKAQTSHPSPEVRQRVGKLIERLDKHTVSDDSLRTLRAVETLERIGSPAARQVLESLAAGPAESEVTAQARVSLERLRQRDRAAARSGDG